MMKLNLFFLGLCCCVATITAAPTNLKDATLMRLLRLLIDEEKKEQGELKIEARQIANVIPSSDSLTIYLQANAADPDNNPRFVITWTDGTNLGSDEAYYNDNPSHSYKIENLTSNTEYTIRVCRHSTTNDPEIENPACSLDQKHSTTSK